VERLEERWVEPFREFRENMDWFLRNKAHIVQNVCYPVQRDNQTVQVMAIVDEQQMKQILARVLDSDEFLSPFGLRSLSRYHAAHPFRYLDREVRYEPAEAEARIKGGNSNWRGPVWLPTSFLMIESLRKLGTAYGPTLTVPSNGSHGPEKTLWQVAEDMANRMIRIFTRDENGRRPVNGAAAKFQDDPHWRDLIQFHEYFNAETGEGLGASHQTGWTGLVAALIDEWRRPPQPSSR
jgi:hypothetical protein